MATGDRTLISSVLDSGFIVHFIRLPKFLQCLPSLDFDFMLFFMVAVALALDDDDFQMKDESESRIAETATEMLKTEL